MSFAIALSRTVPDNHLRIREEIIEYGGVIALCPKVRYHTDAVVSVQVEYQVQNHVVRLMDVSIIGTNPALHSQVFGVDTLPVVLTWLKEAFECEMLNNLPLFSTAVELGENFISEHKSIIVDIYEAQQEQGFLDDNSN